MRILVVRLSSIGDIVHALPAVAALAEHVREAEIHWVVESRYAELLQNNPFVKRVIPVDTLGWRTHWYSPAAWQAALRTLGILRALGPDVAIDFQGLVKSALVARLSRAPNRIGFEGRWLRESLARRLYTETVTAEGRRHVVQENLALVEGLGVRPPSRDKWRFPLPYSIATETRLQERLAALGSRGFIVINPGGGWPSKRWPPGQYANLIRELGRRQEFDILVTGSPAEGSLIDAILRRSQQARAVHFPSTLLEFIALIHRARLFVGGDTGPLHLAAAAGTPIVAIYGPTNPERNGPFAPDDITVSNQVQPGDSPGFAHWGRSQARSATYLEGISMDTVLDAVIKRLARAHGA